MSTMSPMIPAPALSNVYYLATPEDAAPRTPRLSRGLVLRLRALSLYWRVRMMAAEIRDVLRRFGRPMAEPDTTFLEQRAEIILAASPRAHGPARVIDLAEARARLRG
jgi:hypothetical protein